MSLMLHPMKMLHGAGDIVVLDSGFCVLRGLVDIKKKGLYGTDILRMGSTGPTILMVKNKGSLCIQGC